MKNSLKKMSYLVAVAGLAGSVSVNAAPGISYNYAALQFIDQDVDDYDCNQDGLRLSGSLELNSDFFAIGSYSDVSGNRGCGSEAISAGLGYRTVFGADSSIYGTLAAENISPDGSGSDSGLVVAAGLRGFINNNVEAKIQLAHHTTFDGNTVLSGGVAYWFAPQFAATADIGLGTEASEIGLGLRMNF
ncbi:MAG: hypothetical protein Q7T48_09210 [Cellvibrio sp.]|jgi:hypothetical protein|uniref:hypothetical protein n=1 Tax=Cellvibrio sp. TaxID=1965322 RepID=UPI00271C2023|nr:hypothetical protein [Cellvibrio sp.]